MAKVLGLYYSTYGHNEQMATAVAEGVSTGGSDVVIKTHPTPISTRTLSLVTRMLTVHRNLFRTVVLAAAFGALPAASAAAAGAKAASPADAAPRLVVVMVVDGLPQEQVQRYRDQFGQGGLRRLLEQGAAFSNAHQAHGVTETAVGHAAILTGAYPYQHGVVGNEWIDPASGKTVYCTEDTNHTYIGVETKPDQGTSPALLRVDTLGDQLRYATGNRAKVITVAGKDRGAILLAGKTGTAYMYMDKTGDFASSSYYMQSHPAWVQRFQSAKPQDRYSGKSWTPLLAEAAYATDVADPPGAGFPLSYGGEDKRDSAYYKRLQTGPVVDELTLDFARAAIEGENLGRNPAGVPDLLGVSLSSHDYVNHAFGPESRMSHDHLQRLDRMLAGFFGYLDQRIGLDNVLVILTADHGFTNTPEFSKTRQIDARRLSNKKLIEALDQQLATQFGVPKLVKAGSRPNVYFDYALAQQRGVSPADLENAAARFLRTQPGIAEVFTRTQFEAGAVPRTRMGLLMQRAWNRQRSGDLMMVAAPYSIFDTRASGSSHGTPYAYDTNIPLLIMGKRWIKPGAYSEYAESVDIAPTLARLLRVRPPAGAEGRVLHEVLR